MFFSEPELNTEDFVRFLNDTGPAIERAGNFADVSTFHDPNSGQTLIIELPDSLASVTFGYGTSYSPVDQHPILKSIGISGIASIGKLLGTAREHGLLKEITNSVVTTMLEDIAVSIKEESIRKTYLDPKLPDRARIGVMNYATPEQLEHFLLALCELSDTDVEVKSFLAGKINNVLNFATDTERLELIEQLLKAERKSYGPNYVAQVLRSSEDAAGLRFLIHSVSEERLLSLGNSEVTSYTSQVLLREALEKESLPKPLQKEATDREIRDALNKLLDVTKRQLAAIEKRTDLKDTTPYLEYKESIEYNRTLLEDGIKSKSKENDTWQRVNAMIQKMELETRYGIKLTNHEAKFYSNHARWEVSTLNDLAETLKRIPEGVIFLTPLLNEIKRVDSIAKFVLGARYSDGIIRVANYAINQPSVDKLYPGIGSLQVTLTHEIGHGIQLGYEYGSINVDPSGTMTLRPGELRYDFLEFAKLSGWEAVNEARYDIDDKGEFVTLDGERLPLDEPVKHNGQKILLTYDRGVLFSRDADAKFTVDDYAKTNPWEDWAEAFSEYILRPNRLKLYAPRKFDYFEEEFHRYGDK